MALISTSAPAPSGQITAPSAHFSLVLALAPGHAVISGVSLGCPHVAVCDGSEHHLHPVLKGGATPGKEFLKVRLLPAPRRNKTEQRTQTAGHVFHARTVLERPTWARRFLDERHLPVTDGKSAAFATGGSRLPTGHSGVLLERSQRGYERMPSLS
jgi:hypothetical protein